MGIADVICLPSYREGFGSVIIEAAAQCLKGVIDIIAVVTGLNYRILRHRARPVSEHEQLQWTEVWTSANASV